jgi:hypothetical protein
MGSLEEPPPAQGGGGTSAAADEEGALLDAWVQQVTRGGAPHLDIVAAPAPPPPAAAAAASAAAEESTGDAAGGHPAAIVEGGGGGAGTAVVGEKRVREEKEAAPPPSSVFFEMIPADDCYREDGDEDGAGGAAKKPKIPKAPGAGGGGGGGGGGGSGKVVDIAKLFLGAERPFGNGPLSAERRAAWSVVIKAVGQRHRDMAKLLQQFQMDSKKCAQMCQKRFRRDAMACVKTSRDLATRARKIARECGTVFRREMAAYAAATGGQLPAYFSEGQNRSKKETREALEKKRVEEAERERIRQQKRINFLLTQTELFAHFIGQKMGSVSGEGSGRLAQDANTAGAEGDKSALDSREKREALSSAQAALANRQTSTSEFDKDAGAAAAKAGKLSKKADQSLVNSMDAAGLNHKDIEQANEAASIFTGQLKAYQKTGFNWLVSLWEQGLNGILADEMGLGKTVQTIALLSFLAESRNAWGPFLVVAPTSTMHNWVGEMAKFCPQMKVIPYFGANPNERKLLRRMWSSPAALGSPGDQTHWV